MLRIKLLRDNVFKLCWRNQISKFARNDLNRLRYGMKYHSCEFLKFSHLSSFKQARSHLDRLERDVGKLCIAVQTTRSKSKTIFWGSFGRQIFIWDYKSSKGDLQRGNSVKRESWVIFWVVKDRRKSPTNYIEKGSRNRRMTSYPDYHANKPSDRVFIQRLYQRSSFSLTNSVLSSVYGANCFVWCYDASWRFCNKIGNRNQKQRKIHASSSRAEYFCIDSMLGWASPYLLSVMQRRRSWAIDKINFQLR